MNEIPGKNRAEPHRRLLRHTYQEGPGFLFLATRGGRPPGPDIRPDLAGLRFRARCVAGRPEEGIAAALALGVSRASLHRWRTRHQAGGLEALVDQPRGPRPTRLPEWVQQAIIVVRLLTYWNSKRLAAEFTRREIYPLDHHTVDHLLAGLGTARPSTRRSVDRVRADVPTSSGTSTSRARSSCAARSVSTRRCGSSGSSMTTPGS